MARPTHLFQGHPSGQGAVQGRNWAMAGRCKLQDGVTTPKSNGKFQDEKRWSLGDNNWTRTAMDKHEDLPSTKRYVPHRNQRCRLFDVYQAYTMKWENHRKPDLSDLFLRDDTKDSTWNLEPCEWPALRRQDIVRLFAFVGGCFMIAPCLQLFGAEGVVFSKEFPLDFGDHRPRPKILRFQAHLGVS